MGFVRWSARAAAEKTRVNYTIPTLTRFTEKLGKKCTIPSLTTDKLQLQSKDAGHIKSKPRIGSASLLVCTQKKIFGWGLQIF